MPHKILFIDIETVPIRERFGQLSPKMQSLWDKKTQNRRPAGESAEDFYRCAGIWAEFGKIICISAGFFPENEQRRFRIKSFHGDEKTLLTEFKTLLEKHFSSPQHALCAHNGKEFDFPFIARRMIINHIPLPEKLNLSGKKPWEIAHLDTLDMWKFGDYKHYTSVELLAEILEIPSPKEDMSGDDVYRTYYQEQNIAQIIDYCQADVLAVAQIYLRLSGQPILEQEEVFFCKEMNLK